MSPKDNSLADLYDVAVVGAGPAGATAAIYLAQQNRKVVLIDRQTSPREAASVGWLNVRAAPVLAKLGVGVRPLLDQAFRDVTFYSEDFSRTARPNFADAPGYLIDRAQFDDALVKTAADNGVNVVEGNAVVDVKPMETEVVARLSDERTVSSRLLILATGRGSAVQDRLGFTQPARHGTIWTAQVDASLEPGSDEAAPAKGAGPDPRVAVVLGLDRAGSFALSCVSRRGLAVVINWLGEREETLPVLAKMCQALFRHGVVPVDLSAAAPEASLAASPASAALDMDTHVGKHTLLIGDAGGFVCAASNEGIYPAMWSAQIASDVIDAALDSDQSQDELMTFESKWRTTMADYLRSPNTDIQFLLPLIFSNQPMADRMGGAFFSGENI
jgi:flavin-dependent dehydrogenase